MAVYRLVFTPETVADIVNAAEYYEEQKKGLGKRFRSFVKGKLNLIKKSPQVYAARYGEVRFALVDFFPYCIHFSIHEAQEVVQVHAVLCQYRNPMKFWKGFTDYPPIAIICRFCSYSDLA